MAKQNVTAFIYDKRGKLLSVGRNSYIKTHPLQARLAAKVNLEHNVFLHAEVDALIKCKDWGKAYRMVVIRTSSSGNALNAKPCPVCQEALKLAKISVVEHS